MVFNVTKTRKEEDNTLGDARAKAQGRDDNDKTNKEILMESEYYRENLLPVDRGWAWVICFAGFLSSFLFGVSNQTMAVLFLEVIDLYDTTITTASLIFLLTTLGAGCVSAFSTNVIVPRLGEKCVVCIAGVFYGASSVGLFLSPNIRVFLCFAAMKGAAVGAAFVPVISLIRHYFHRRRSIAQIVSRAGASVAIIFVPPLVRAVRKEVGVKGTFLIIAAVELHLVLVGLLLRPISAYRFRPELPPLTKKQKKGSKSEAQKQQSSSGEDASPNGADNLKPVGTTLNHHQNGKDHVDGFPTSETNPNYSRHHHDNETSLNGVDGDCLESDQKNGGVGRSGVQNSVTGSSEVDGEGEAAGLLKTPGHDLANHTTEWQCSQDSKRGGGAGVYSSALSLASGMGVEEAALSVEVEDGTHGEEEKEKEQKTGCCRYQFCSLWAYRLVIAATPVGATNITLRNYIPTVAVSQGATLDEAASLMTMMGILDLASRLALGFFADTHILSPSQIVVVSHVLLGITCHLVHLYTTFPSLVVMVCLIGATIGTRISMLPLVCIEVVGVEMMPQAFSISSTIGMFSASAMNPAIGAVAESTGSFVAVMHIFGTCFFLSAAILSLLPIALRVDRRKGIKSN